MTRPLDQRMAMALCEIMRGVWHDGWDEMEIRDCMSKHDLMHDAVADQNIANQTWAMDAEIGVGDTYEALDAGLLALEKAGKAPPTDQPQP